MPPKTSGSKPNKSTINSEKEASEAINQYLAQKPDFEKLIREAKESSSRSLTETRQTEYNKKVKAAVKEVYIERQNQKQVKQDKIENA